MEYISIFVDLLYTGLIDPVKEQLSGLFGLKKRQAFFYIVIAYLVAFVLYRDKSVRNDPSVPKSYWQFIGGKSTFLHPSALLDYQYFFLQPILKVIIISPFLALIFFPDLVSGQSLSRALTSLFGVVENPITPNYFIFFLYGTIAFLISDFSHYWIHRLFHSNTWLWEFHKVHHVAEVLVPPTANRVHFVEIIFEGLLGFTLVSHLSGFMFYICGEEVSIIKIAGIGYLAFFFNCIGANLRHTHIWLSFGPKVERFINSPAQHQIHHSTDPKHFNKNFGTNFSIWDWMFGTLYVTTSTPENITFGLGDKESKRFQTVPDLLFAPFIAIFSRSRKLIKRKFSQENAL